MRSLSRTLTTRNALEQGGCQRTQCPLRAEKRKPARHRIASPGCRLRRCRELRQENGSRINRTSPQTEGVNEFDITHHGYAVAPATPLSLGAAPPWAFSRPLPRGSRLPCAKIPHSRQLRALRHTRDECFELRSPQTEGLNIPTLGGWTSCSRLSDSSI